MESTKEKTGLRELKKKYPLIDKSCLQESIKAKIRGDAGFYNVWAIDWIWQKALVSRNSGDEWVKFDKLDLFFVQKPKKSENGP